MKTKSPSSRLFAGLLGLACLLSGLSARAADLTVGHLTATNGLAAYGAVIASTNLSAGGFVGIGTTNPEIRLTIDADAAANYLGLMLKDSGVGKAWFTLAPCGNGAGFLNQNDLVIRSDGRRMAFNFWGGLDVMVIDGWHGHVGIGTTAPTEALDVAGNIKTCGQFIGNGGGIYLSPQGDLGMGAFINGMPAGCGEEALAYSAANQFNAKVASGQFTNPPTNLKGLYEQAR